MAERFDQETAKDYNREPGIVIVPGSNYAKEMAKFEQFPSAYGANPGNPYVYRPFPKMLYRAELWQGKPLCMAADPNPVDFSNPNELNRVQEQARQFTEKCQRIVNDEREYQKAMENGWREHPSEAVEYLQGRLRSEANAAAERNYADRNMSDSAKVESKVSEAAIFDEEGRHAGEIPEKPKKRRGRPPKNPQQ